MPCYLKQLFTISLRQDIQAHYSEVTQITNINFLQLPKRFTDLGAILSSSIRSNHHTS